MALRSCSVLLFLALLISSALLAEEPARAAVRVDLAATTIVRGENAIIDATFDRLRAGGGERQPDLIFLQILSDPNTLLPVPEGVAERVWLPVENAPHDLGAVGSARHVMPTADMAAGRYSLRVMCVQGETESFSEVTTFEVVEP